MNFWEFLDRNAFGIFLLILICGGGAAKWGVDIVRELRQPCECIEAAP